MTLIVAYANEAKSYIASDQQGSNSHSKEMYKNNKVFKLGKMLVGGCGSYKQLQMLERHFTVPKRGEDEALDDYMYKTFVPALTDFFKNNGLLTSKDGIDNNSDGEFIFVLEGRIFKWQSDLALLETCRNFDTTGSGAEYAHAISASLEASGVRMKPERRLKHIINLTSDYVMSVGGEPVIISTDTKR